MKYTKADPSIKEGFFNTINVNKRIIVYVYGFNFYYGLKSKNWKSYYWLDMVGFFESLIKPYQEIVEVVYFSAESISPDKRERQSLLFTANKLNPKFKLVLGKYLKKRFRCSSCGFINKTFEEKETDVRIATTLLSDAYANKCDIAILVSADSDFVPPIERIKELNPRQKIYVYFPPNRYSTNLAKLCHGSKNLEGCFAEFRDNVLPDSITLPSGFVVKRPENWRGLKGW